MPFNFSEVNFQITFLVDWFWVLAKERKVKTDINTKSKRNILASSPLSMFC